MCVVRKVYFLTMKMCETYDLQNGVSLWHRAGRSVGWSVSQPAGRSLQLSFRQVEVCGAVQKKSRSERNTTKSDEKTAQLFTQHSSNIYETFRKDFILSFGHNLSMSLPLLLLIEVYIHTLECEGGRARACERSPIVHGRCPFPECSRLIRGSQVTEMQQQWQHRPQMSADTRSRCFIVR